MWSGSGCGDVATGWVWITGLDVVVEDEGA